MIHKYSMNGYNIVLDTYSGAVHMFDDLSYELVDYTSAEMPRECPANAIEDLTAKGYAKSDIEECYAELYELVESEQLHTADDYEKFVSSLHREPLIKSMCLNISHDCNLRCEYCFAAKGDFGHGRCLMSAEVGKAAIDFLIKHSGTRHNLELDFFGGEPLMNFDVVKTVVEYAREQEKIHNKNFRFTITTNGVALNDERIDFINREMSNVVLSLDGRKEVNDRFRVYPNGRGCYDDIVPKFQKLVAQRDKNKDYYVRGTFTKENLDFAEDVLHYNSLGFDQLSIEPVVSDPALVWSIGEEDLPEIFAEYERLAHIIIERKKQGKCFNFFHFMLDLEQGPCALKRLRGCGCGLEYVAVTPEGDIYPCHQFVGIDGWKMGSVLTDTVDTSVQERFNDANIYGKPACRDCWARFYCSGGCNANSLQYSGDMLKPHKISCELEKKRVECAIMIKAALAREDGQS